MMGILEFVWRVVDLLSLLWDLILSWRLILSIFVALGAVLVLREVGVSVDGGSFAIAALIGFVGGLAWELLSAGARRGYA
jgi:uncharacterized membrane protein (DUF373 family)